MFPAFVNAGCKIIPGFLAIFRAPESHSLHTLPIRVLLAPGLHSSSVLLPRSFYTVKMEAAVSSETLVNMCQTAWHHIAEVSNLGSLGSL
jgi:hypothetical protein